MADRRDCERIMAAYLGAFDGHEPPDRATLAGALSATLEREAALLAVARAAEEACEAIGDVARNVVASVTTREARMPKSREEIRAIIERMEREDEERVARWLASDNISVVKDGVRWLAGALRGAREGHRASMRLLADVAGLADDTTGAAREEE